MYRNRSLRPLYLTALILLMTVLIYVCSYACVSNLESLAAARETNQDIQNLIAGNAQGNLTGEDNRATEDRQIIVGNRSSDTVQTDYDENLSGAAQSGVVENVPVDVQTEWIEKASSTDQSGVVENVPADVQTESAEKTSGTDQSGLTESVPGIVQEELGEKASDSDMTGSAETVSAYEQKADEKSIYEELKDVNPDFVCILEVPAIGLKYPVAASKDNKEYLGIMFDETENPSGSLFLDMAADRLFNDRHTIIFGHNMRDGSMFGSLKRFSQDFALAADMPLVLVEMENETREYRIFAFRTVSAADRAVYGFPESDAEYDAWLGATLEQAAWLDAESLAQIRTGRPDILTLSTCWGTEHRYNFVVHAARIS